MEMETRKWCQTTWLVKPFRKIGMLTYLSHYLTLNWSDLRPDFEIDLSRSKSTMYSLLSTCSEPARRGEHDSAIFIFRYLIWEQMNHDIFLTTHISHDIDYVARSCGSCIIKVNPVVRSWGYWILNVCIIVRPRRSWILMFCLAVGSWRSWVLRFCLLCRELLEFLDPGLVILRWDPVDIGS